jgi:hypothetical protein
MRGAIPESIIMALARSQGYMEQLPLFTTPPRYSLEEQYIRTVYNGIKCVDDGTGNSGSVLSYIDHPAFTALRNRLESTGYIKTNDWINGDCVVNAFYLNGYLFEEGEQFLSAGAILWCIKQQKQCSSKLLPVKVDGEL